MNVNKIVPAPVNCAVQLVGRRYHVVKRLTLPSRFDQAHDDRDEGDEKDAPGVVVVLVDAPQHD